MSQKTSLLEGLLEVDGNLGSIGLKSLVEARQVALNRWEGIGLLEGLQGAMRENMASLFESQAYYLLKEADTSSVGGSFETISFPLVRRTYQKLLANELVSVQALNMPIGRLFFFNPQISTGQHRLANYTTNGAGQGGPGTYDGVSLYDAFYAETADAYGNSLYDRTNGAATNVRVGSTAADGALIVRSTYTKGDGVLKLTVAAPSLLQTGKMNGAQGVPGDSESFLPSLRVINKVSLEATNASKSANTYNTTAGGMRFGLPAQRYGQALVTNGTATVATVANTPVGKFDIDVDMLIVDNSGNYVGATDRSGDGTDIITADIEAGTVFEVFFKKYASLEGSDTMAEISFKFDSVTVDASEPRKLRANWSPEVQQDVQAFQSVDVEAEMTALLSETISAEIDRTIMRQIKNEASWLDRWNYGKYNSMLLAGTAIGITQKDFNQTLITKINQMSAMIQKSTLRGGASWIVVSPEVAAVFRDLEYFHVTNASPEERKFSLGIEKIGAIHNDYQVFVDMYATADTILVGHKGDGIFHAGFIFAPYTPIMLFPKVTSVADFKSVMGVMTRYATKMVNNRFYVKIFVDNLQQVVTCSLLRTGA